MPPPPHQQHQQQDALLGAAGAGELVASAAGQALLENKELRFGRILFSDAVCTVLEAREAPAQEVIALIDELVDALADASADSLALRAAFFLGCSLLTGGSGAVPLAQQLDLLSTMSNAAFCNCLVHDSRTVLRSYRLLRSCALAVAASLDTPTCNRKSKTGDVPSLVLSTVQTIVSIPFAAQSSVAAATEETINVLMHRVFETALPSLRKVVASIFGECVAVAQPAVACQLLRHCAISFQCKQSGRSKALDTASVAAGELMVQLAGISRNCTAMCSIFLSPMLLSTFNCALPTASVKYCLQLVTMCAESGACPAQEAMSIMLAACSGQAFDAQTRAVAVRLAGSIASRAVGASEASRFINDMTCCIKERRWHAEAKTVRLEVLKSIALVASKTHDVLLASHSLTTRLARQLHLLLAEVLTYDPTDIEQFIVALCRTLSTLPAEQLSVVSLMVCLHPLQQHTEVQPDASHQILAVAASCLIEDSALTRKNWQVVASVSISERKAVRNFVCSLRKLHPLEVDEAIAIHPMRRFVQFIETDPDQPYENIHELQLLAECADDFAEATQSMLKSLCTYLQKPTATSDPASAACVLQILKVAIGRFPETRSQVMEIFNDERAISTFITCGLHAELLSIIWTTHNRRKNSLSLVASIIHVAESTQISLCPILELCGELALCFVSHDHFQQAAACKRLHLTSILFCSVTIRNILWKRLLQTSAKTWRQTTTSKVSKMTASIT
eukprot:COSAG02_NODE_1524_length_12129_cov_3.373067_3_plen_735_part_00